MTDNGDKVIESVTRKALIDAARINEPADAGADRKIPDGCVARVLNFRERNLIVGACRVYSKGDRGKFKGQFKVDAVVKLMSFDETTEYYGMINDSQAENLFRWQEDRQLYVAWKSMKGGMMKVEDFVKQFPAADIDACPQKPSVQQPRLTREEERGKPREFYIPSKIDAFIQDALRDMDWSAVSIFGSEYVVELMTKYGISPDE